MLSMKVFEFITGKIKGFDFPPINPRGEASPDYIEAFDPDGDFEDFMFRSRESERLRRYITDNGADFMEFTVPYYEDGNRVTCVVRISRGDDYYGVLYRATVKSLQTVLNGKVRYYPGFDVLQSVKNS